MQEYFDPAEFAHEWRLGVVDGVIIIATLRDDEVVSILPAVPEEALELANALLRVVTRVTPEVLQ